MASKHVEMKKILAILFMLLVVLLGCQATPQPTETMSQPTPTTQNLSDQIAGIDIVETTALTSLLRISEELDKARDDGSLSEEEQAELRTDLMEKLNDWVNVREDQLNLSGLNLLPAQEQIAWTEQESALLEGVAERIEHYRKGDATVLVVNAAGTPVTDNPETVCMLETLMLMTLSARREQECKPAGLTVSNRCTRMRKLGHISWSPDYGNSHE